MADDQSLDKLVYSFIAEDVFGGLFISVPPGHVACVYDRGKGVLKKVFTPGLHLKIPFWQKAKLFNTQTLEYAISDEFDLRHINALGDQPIKCVTSDKEEVEIEGTMLLRLDAKLLPSIWQNIGEDFIPKVIRPAIRSKVRTVCSRFTADEIISTNRDAVEADMVKTLTEVLHNRGIYVENVLLGDTRVTS
jgi:regulator of protease activity HflC (stomatin/prohibitin superfamily)